LANGFLAYPNRLLYVRQAPMQDVTHANVTLFPDNTYKDYVSKQFWSMHVDGKLRWNLLGSFRGTCRADPDQSPSYGRCTFGQLLDGLGVRMERTPVLLNECDKAIMFDRSSAMPGYLYQTAKRMVSSFIEKEKEKEHHMLKSSGTLKENIVASQGALDDDNRW